LAPAGGVARDFEDGACQIAGTIGGDDEAFDTVSNEKSIVADVGGDDRAAGGQRLQDGVGHGLGAAGADEDVDGGKKERHVLGP